MGSVHFRRLFCTFAHMARMSISKAREKMAEVIELAATEAVILEKHGKPTAVVISYERYDELMDALETLEDLAAEPFSFGFLSNVTATDRPRCTSTEIGEVSPW